MNDRFIHIINSQKPVLVDFYADWCIPCRLMPAVLKELKELYKTRIRIIKVNVDDYPDIATICQVQNIPAIVLFYNGKIQWCGIGVQKLDDIAVALKEII